ncbi:MAG: type II secretion system F family protein, partial [Campylobacterales bacterium]
MAYYQIVYKERGRKKSINIEARNKAEAISLLKSRHNGIAIKIREVAPPLMVRLNELKERLLSYRPAKTADIQKLAVIIRQIAVMINAGLSFNIILAEVIASTDDPLLHDIFKKALEDINAGLSFSEALRKFEYELGGLTVSMVELGEKTGNMALALHSTADMLEEIRDNRIKLKKALRYPMMTVGAIVIAFTIIVIYVIPKFKAIFSKLGSDLPLPTQILIAIEEGLRSYGLPVLGALVVLIVSVRYLYRTQPNFRLAFDANLLKIYLIGQIIHLAQMARFNLSLAELMKAGLPVAEALETAVATVDNAYMNQRLKSVGISISRGISLTEAIRETKLFEGMIIQMINAGESSGSLDDMLQKAADYYRL